MKKNLILISLLTLFLSTFSVGTLQAGEIHDAAGAGDLTKVRELIEADSTLLNSKGELGFTPLHSACRTKQVEIVNFLINKGADIHATDNFRFTPFNRACGVPGQDLTLLKRFIDLGADVNSVGYNGLTPLHLATLQGNPQIANLLLKNGADVNSFDNYTGKIKSGGVSGTVLQVAINGRSKNEEMAKLLIENGANLDKRDVNGNTELHLAALKGFSDLTKCLIEHGANVNATNDYNRTPLYYAAKHGYRRVAEILIAAGADQNTIAETNYDKAPQLSANLKDGEAWVWSLSSQGFAVKTKDNLIIFNPSKINESPEAGLANGQLNPKELAGQKITGIITLPERWWPYYSDAFNLAKQISGVETVIYPKPGADLKDYQNIPSYRPTTPNENFSINELKVHSIPVLAGGMGFLVEADGIKVFHAGLHVGSKKASQLEKFHNEIDFLKPFGPIDIVFLSVHAHSNEVEQDYNSYLYLLDQLKPKTVYLFGANIPEQYSRCTEVLEVRDIPVKYPEGGRAFGERFHYQRENPPVPHPSPGLDSANTSLQESDYRICWSRIADYPVRLSELSAIAMGDRIHVVGGKITNDNQDLADNRDVDYHYEYDPATNRWTQLSGMTSPHYDVALTELNGRIHAVSSAHESYDPATNSWQQLASLPNGSAHLGSAVVGGEIFVFSAEGPERCSQNMAYNPKTNKWRTCAPIPTSRLFPVVAALDNKIYVLGGLGYDDRGRLGSLSHEIEVYNPATDQWEAKAPMPDGIFGATAVGTFDRKLFLVGVSKGKRLADSRQTAEIYIYDPETANWSRTTDCPHNYGSAGLAFQGNRIYLIGGHDQNFKQYSDAYVGVIEKIANPASQPVIEIGRKYSIQSKHLDETIDLVVHLPENYESKQETYPVLYLLGSNYRSRFALTASTLDYMNSQGQIPKILLVGMDLPHGNFGLIPKAGENGTSSADRYMAALKDEVFPYVNSRFRTNNYRILYGASNCGIFTLYALLEKTFPVQAYIASSPMIGWSTDLIMKLTKDAFEDPERSARTLFLIESDDDFGRVTNEFPKFVNLLETSAPSWLNWKAEIRENSGHVPEVDLPLGLRAIFPDYNPPSQLETLQSLIDHYTNLTRRYGFEIRIPTFLLFDLGFDLAFANKLDESQKIFEYAVKNHPQQARSFAGLGLVHQRRGNMETAITYFEKALAIDERQGLARRMLAEIRGEK